VVNGPRLCGLYAITDSALLPGERLVAAVAQAIQGGAQLIQYRDKGSDRDQRRWEASDLLNLCRSLDVPLIINDDVELARAVGADGVHLGANDVSLAEARSLLGETAIIGVSCYDQLERALEAQAAGADYAAFGRFFASATKPGAVGAPAELLARARSRLTLPIVAIGGITAENGAALVDAGADMLAAVHGVFGQTDVTAAAARYAVLFG